MNNKILLVSLLTLTTLGTLTLPGNTHQKPNDETSQSFNRQSLTGTSTKFVKPSSIIAQTTMTGVWNCNDGGVYYIRQVGNQLWWYGQSSDGGATWSNVFQGTIRGNKIVGSWADVPKGSIRGSGEMTLLISGGKIKKISGGENFGGSIWSR